MGKEAASITENDSDTISKHKAYPADSSSVSFFIPSAGLLLFDPPHGFKE